MEPAEWFTSNVQNAISRLYSPLRTSSYEPTAGLTSTCLRTEVKDYQVTLGSSVVSTSTPLVFVALLVQEYTVHLLLKWSLLVYAWQFKTYIKRKIKRNI